MERSRDGYRGRYRDRHNGEPIHRQQQYDRPARDTYR